MCFGLVINFFLCHHADAFVCSRTVGNINPNDASGASLVWSGRSVPYTLNQNGTSQLPLDTVASVIKASFLVWQNLVLSTDMQPICGNLPGTDMRFRATDVSLADWVGYNYLNPNSNNNLIIFRDTNWPYSSTSSGDIIALTTVTYSSVTGTILDADIEFNSATFKFSIIDANHPNTVSSVNVDFDLMNTTVHEVGHLLGLAHCGISTCDQNQVMEPFAAPGEIIKRQLKCDDRAAMVFKYPAGLPNGYCSGAVDATCGFCAPPSTLSLEPTVTLMDVDTGRASPSCANAGVNALWLLFLPMLLRYKKYLLCCILLLLCSTAGCNTEPQIDCAGLGSATSVSANPNDPLILNIQMLEQVPGDPWHVVLGLDFFDKNGDLGNGNMLLFVNNQTTAYTTYALQDLFATSGPIVSHATSGRIGFVIVIDPNSPNDSILHIGCLLVDNANNLSNCYGLDFSIALSTNVGI